MPLKAPIKETFPVLLQIALKCMPSGSVCSLNPFIHIIRKQSVILNLSTADAQLLINRTIDDQTISFILILLESVILHITELPILSYVYDLSDLKD